MTGCSIGFSATLDNLNSIDSKTHSSMNVTHKDLISYGLIPEFASRLPIIAVLEDISIELMERILIKPKNSLIKQFIELFKMDGIHLTFSHDAITYFAQKALGLGIGARGLRSILNDFMLPIMYEAPQDELLKEVKVLVKNGNITYESIHEMRSVENF